MVKAFPIPTGLERCIERCRARLYGQPEACGCKPPSRAQRAILPSHKQAAIDKARKRAKR